MRLTGRNIAARRPNNQIDYISAYGYLLIIAPCHWLQNLKMGTFEKRTEDQEDAFLLLAARPFLRSPAVARFGAIRMDFMCILMCSVLQVAISKSAAA